jgi:spermidine/putrescine transport system substrate-binding protein
MTTKTKHPATRRALVAVALASALQVATADAAPTTLNLLAWCDHTDATLFQPFEKANNVKVNVKSYELTGAAISILEQSRPGDWDAFVVDSADVVRMGKAGWLAPLSKADFPYADFFEAAKTPQLHESGGKLWAVPEKFGFNTLAYDTRKFAKDGKPAVAGLFAKDAKGRVAVYDYYLPVIQTLGLMRGVKPADFKEADLKRVEPDLMALKKQSKVVGDMVTVETALANGDVDVLLGAAEWVASLKKEKPHIDWGNPVEGGMRWSQSVGVFRQSTKPALALKLAQYLVSPEGQARVATATCYWAMPINRKAALTDAQKKALRFERVEDYLANSYAYGAVDEALDAKMQDLWARFLAGK